MCDFRKLATAALAAIAVTPILVFGQDAAPVKIGMVTFLSGPAAGPFGVPARNAAELMVQMLNDGKVPAPYAAKGFGGSPIETVVIDEAGSTTTQVTEYRNLVQRHNVDLVVGYIGSGNCIAIAPAAEELKKLTIFFSCATPRVFEERSYKYVFRTCPTGTVNAVGAALYLKDVKPKLKSISGINQNYAFGQDAWADFVPALKNLFPNIEIKTSQMPKVFAGQYSTEISALLGSRSDLIHTSFWGGDLEALLLQAAPRGLFKKSTGLLVTGEPAMYKLADKIPDGTIIGADGPYGPFAPDTALNRWFVKEFQDRYQVPPNYASNQMALGILGAKAAWEKALAANGGKRPSNEQVAAAFENSTFDGPGGTVRMASGKGHQAIMETAYGMSKVVGGKMTITNVKRYAAEKVNPPDGVKSADWIKGGFKN